MTKQIAQSTRLAKMMVANIERDCHTDADLGYYTELCQQMAKGLKPYGRKLLKDALALAALRIQRRAYHRAKMQHINKVF